MSKKRDIELFIVDLLLAIHKVKLYTKEFSSYDDLQYSGLHWDASMRQLEIVGESINRLLDDEFFASLSPKYFRKVVNFRNSIVHGYFGIDAEEVWDIIKNKLDILEVDLLSIIEKHFDLSYAISLEIEEYKNIKDIEMVKYLTQLEEKF
jgi:uncharacterized protein with HEPN domain